MNIKPTTIEISKLNYILIFFLFTAAAFYGLNKYPPFIDYDSSTMSIFINNLSYNSSYDFGFKNSNKDQDIYRQYWAAHFLPTSIPMSTIQRLFLIPAFKTDIFLKIISLIIGIIGCFFASLLLPTEEAQAKGSKFFLMFISLFAPISFLYFRTAVINIMMSFMLFWAAIYIFYRFVNSEKNRYLYILSIVLAYYGKNPYLHIVFLPPIFLGYLIYKKFFMKLFRNKHFYLAAVLMIILYTGITFILAAKYDNSYASFTQKTEQFLKLRGHSMSLSNVKLNLFKYKALKYINQHVFPKYDLLGDTTRDDRIWTLNGVEGPWQLLYVFFVMGFIGNLIRIFSGKNDDVTILFLIITSSIILLCFIFSFPEGRYMLPIVPCYSFFILRTVNFICVKSNISLKLNPLIYSVIVLVLCLHTYSLITGSYNKFFLKNWNYLYGLKQGIEYIRNNDQAGHPLLYSNNVNDKTLFDDRLYTNLYSIFETAMIDKDNLDNILSKISRKDPNTYPNVDFPQWRGDGDVNYTTLLYNRLYSNFEITLIDQNDLDNILSKININDTNTYPNVYFLHIRSTLTNLTYKGFPLVKLAEYNDEYADEPMCLLKLGTQFDTANPLNQLNYEAYYNRGMAFEKMGQLDNAIKNYNKAIDLNPAFYQVYNNRGILYGKAGIYPKAIEDFNQAIILNPKCAFAYNNRGFTYEMMNMFDQALEDYNKAIEYDQNDSLANDYVNRGNLYLKRGNKELAISDFSKACTLGNKEGCDALRAAQSR